MLDKIKNEGLKEGRRLEVTLFEGAEYYNGDTPAPTHNMEGYDPTKEMTSKPGIKLAGYIVKFDQPAEKEYHRMVMSNGMSDNPWKYGLKQWYVSENCIHSFSK